MGNSLSLALRCFENSLLKFLVFAEFLLAIFEYLTKHHLNHSLFLFWILINPSSGFFGSLGNGKSELPSQGAISEITSWYWITEVIFQPDPLCVHFPTLDKCWLCWISSTSSIFISSNSTYSKPNLGSENNLFLKSLSFLVNSIGKFC